MVLKQTKKNSLNISKTQNKKEENEVINFGCRLNIYEGEIIKNLARKAGLKNFTIFNSCAVTKESERQLRQAIRKHKKQNPNNKTIVTGCVAQTSSDTLKKMKEIDFIIGNREKLKLKSYENLDKKIHITNIFKNKDISFPLIINSFEKHTKAFVPIQTGCNNNCAYCIVPQGRGRAISYEMADIIKQCKTFVKNGYKEIVLTGTDISSYGVDVKDNKINLTFLISEILKQIPKLQRLRLSSLDPAYNYDELFEILKTEKRLMPFFHLSMQSGDNTILKLMKRRHKTNDIKNFIKKARKINPYAAIGADIITGFPGETEKLFKNTYKFVKKMQISHLHIFSYSNRPQTAAINYPNQLPKNIIKQRTKMLIKLGEKIYSKFLKKNKRKNLSILIESPGNKGYSENNIFVKLAKKYKENEIITIKLSQTLKFII